MIARPMLYLLTVDTSHLQATKNMIKKLDFLLGRVENIVGEGENIWLPAFGYQHSLVFLQCFQKASYTVVLKVGIEW